MRLGESRSSLTAKARAAYHSRPFDACILQLLNQGRLAQR